MSKLSECYSSILNPVGNYLPFDNMKRQSACINSNTINNIGIQQLYKMPVTNSYPDTTHFAHYLYRNQAECRDTSYICKKNAYDTIDVDKLQYYDMKPYQQVERS